MMKKGSVHIIMYNPNFERDSDYDILPDDFEILKYQEHMRITKGKPTKTVRAFLRHPAPVSDKWDESRTQEKPKPEFADGLKQDVNVIKESVPAESFENESTFDAETSEIIKKVKKFEPTPRELSQMNKKQIIQVGNELGIDLQEDTLKRDMIIMVKEFMDNKKKIDDMKEIDDKRFPGV